MLQKSKAMECSACGASQFAACNCGVAYVPVITAAARALAKPENKNKSSRTIEAETGIPRRTIDRVRKSGGSNGPPEKRTGKDGKSYKLPKPKSKSAVVHLASDPIQEECEDCNNDQERWQRSFSNLAGDAIALRSYWTRQFPKWKKFEVTSSLVKLAKQATEEWSQVASELDRRLAHAKAKTKVAKD